MEDKQKPAVDTAGPEDSGSPDVAAIIEQKVAAILDSKLSGIAEVVDASKNKIQRRNDELANQLKAERERAETLESKLKELGLADGGSVDQKLSAKDEALRLMRADLEANNKQMAEIQAQWKADQSKLRRKELEDLVLGDVASDAREDGRMLISGYLGDRRINLDDTDDLATLAKTMRDRFLPRLAAPTADRRDGTPSATQPGTPADPNKVNWSNYSAYDQVPPELRSHIPDDVFEAWIKPKGGGGAGLRI